ncbi:L-threonylcarbamoyladenylate synthase [Fulvimarina sp. 2208YS6-2-32]|uniref:Threonylcarbamoyl-AMP synthase n=1 Tax=Fulvimarina uroteuthidis TaxID=3098149 RepID=A0ABU5I3X1_9HYPH|nr:L-threonylcarbamoyladenylate synthase [Fulvimarina sp. 2208YS6-2-32]MDY8109653.1 L-threonylcarbamoyladenylate synthase [Fulvimarina sp. 2208YS6-2-32]
MSRKIDDPIIRDANDPAAIGQALELLRAGQCVAVPTETVYGLAADATNGDGVARIFAAKGRPSFNPLICHVPDMGMADRLAFIDPLSEALMAAFWPGALTIVCRLREESGIHPLATAGLDTVGLRSPVGVMSALARALGQPLAAPSANKSGRVSPTSAAHVAASLEGRIPLILDGGAARVGVESTIVRVEADHIALLRPGGISRGAIAQASGRPVRTPSRGASNPIVTAPGQLTSHYAPTGAVRLDAEHVEPHEWLIAFGPRLPEGHDAARGIINLSPSGDLREAAANLFGALAAIDRPAIRAIAVMPIPDEGLGEAINDRLKRAAAPRD